MKTLSDFEIGYLAGLLDGEGHVTVMRRKTKRLRVNGSIYGIYDTYSISVVISNNVIACLDWIVERMGGKIYGNYSKTTRGNRKPAYKWYLNGQKSRDFLILMYPNVIIKKRQIEVALEFLKLGDKVAPSARAEFYVQMRKLNHRGIEEYNGTQHCVSDKNFNENKELG